MQWQMMLLLATAGTTACTAAAEEHYEETFTSVLFSHPRCFGSTGCAFCASTMYNHDIVRAICLYILCHAMAVPGTIAPSLETVFALLLEIDL
jgi:hypothetical protein